MIEFHADFTPFYPFNRKQQALKITEKCNGFPVPKYFLTELKN